MASGLPIACSDRGPMPEVLGDGGVYFNPENPQSIADAVNMIIDNKDLRAKGIEVSKEISNQYLWKINSEKTFQFLTETIQKNEQN